MGTAVKKKKLALTRSKREEQEPKQRPLDFRLIRRLMEFTGPHARKRNWLLLTVVLRAVQLPCIAFMIGAIINGPITNGSVGGTVAGAAGFLALVLFTQATFHYRIRLALELGDAVVHDLRKALFEHLQRMPMSFYNRTKLGRIISRFTSDTAEVRTGVQDVLFVSLVGSGQMLVSAAFMLWCDPLLFSVMMAMAPILWFINRYFRTKLSECYRDMQESFSRVTSTLAESVNGVRVTQGFARQDVNAGLFSELAAEHSQYTIKAERTAGLFLPLIDLNSQAFVSALLVIGAWRVLRWEEAMSVGNLIQFFFLTNNFFSPIQILGNMYNAALTAMAGAERVFALLDSRPDWEDSPTAVCLPPIEGRVEFRAVGFAYEPGRPVLEDISFSATPGETIALVGHTGSGKTSIINLIAKFYLPSEGEVLIDGYDVRQVQTESLHRQLGIVLQQNFLFTGTLLDNIRIGRPEATDAEVRRAAEELDCLDLLEMLPGGLQMEVGERGLGLSLGQRQLVCFCRALLADPRILILDEATSSVDTLTELRIQRALSRLTEHRTSFIVAHRLSTVRHASQVLVLEQGRMVEHGTHDSLLKSEGVYAGLYAQFIRAE